MAAFPTIKEIEDGICSHAKEHKFLHTRLADSYIDLPSSLVLQAWIQVKRSIVLLESGVSDPEDHKAEALLLMLFQDLYFWGYTPKKERDETPKPGE